MDHGCLVVCSNDGSPCSGPACGRRGERSSACSHNISSPAPTTVVTAVTRSSTRPSCCPTIASSPATTATTAISTAAITNAIAATSANDSATTANDSTISTVATAAANCSDRLQHGNLQITTGREGRL